MDLEEATTEDHKIFIMDTETYQKVFGVPERQITEICVQSFNDFLQRSETA